MASSGRLKPGASGAIRVLLDTRNRMGSRIFKTVEVFSNDPKNPKVVLTLKGEI